MANATATPMTMTQKIVAIAVAIIIISTVAAPVIQDLQDGESTILSNTGSRFSLVEADEKITVSTIDSFACINGVSIRSLFPDAATTVLTILSDVVVANIYYTNDTYSNCYITSPELFPEATNFSQTLSTGTLVFDNGVVTFTDAEENSTSAAYDYVFIPDTDGDYGSWLYSGSTGFDQPIYVDSGKKIYAYYRTTGNALSASGTLDDMNVNLMVRSGAIDEETTMTLDYQNLSNGTNLLESMSFDPSFSGSVSVLAPLKYTVTEDVEQASLFGVILLLLFLVPVMMAVRMIALRRN